MAQFFGERTYPGMPYDTAMSCAKMAEPIKRSFGLCSRMGMGCTLAPPGQYYWTVHVRGRCGFLSHYFDHLSMCVNFLSLGYWKRWIMTCFWRVQIETDDSAHSPDVLCGTMRNIPVIYPLLANFVILTFTSDDLQAGGGFEITYKIISRQGLQYGLSCVVVATTIAPSQLQTLSSNYQDM